MTQREGKDNHEQYTKRLPPFILLPATYSFPDRWLSFHLTRSLLTIGSHGPRSQCLAVGGRIGPGLGIRYPSSQRFGAYGPGSGDLR